MAIPKTFKVSALEAPKGRGARAAARELKHEDTICVFKLGAKPDTLIKSQSLNE